MLGVRKACQELADSVHEIQQENDQLKAENAKLRKLCERFAEYVSQDRCEGCVSKRRCDEGDIDECWQRTEIRDMAREVGIEVE